MRPGRIFSKLESLFLNAGRPGQLVLRVAEGPPSGVAEMSGAARDPRMLLNRRSGPRAVAHRTADDRIAAAAAGKDVYGLLTLVPRMLDDDARIQARTRRKCGAPSAHPVRVGFGIKPRRRHRAGSVAGNQHVVRAALCRGKPHGRRRGEPAKRLFGERRAQTRSEGLRRGARLRLDDPRRIGRIRESRTDGAAVAAAGAAGDDAVTLRALCHGLLTL